VAAVFPSDVAAHTGLSDPPPVVTTMPTNKRRSNTVLIALDADDTYTVTLSRSKRGDRFTTEPVEHVIGVYNDGLSSVVLGFDR
jgi:hypothetical protein